MNLTSFPDYVTARSQVPGIELMNGDQQVAVMKNYVSQYAGWRQSMGMPFSELEVDQLENWALIEEANIRFGLDEQQIGDLFAASEKGIKIKDKGVDEFGPSDEVINFGRAAGKSITHMSRAVGDMLSRVTGDPIDVAQAQAAALETDLSLPTREGTSEFVGTVTGSLLPNAVAIGVSVGTGGAGTPTMIASLSALGYMGLSSAEMGIQQGELEAILSGQDFEFSDKVATGIGYATSEIAFEFLRFKSLTKAFGQIGSMIGKNSDEALERMARNLRHADEDSVMKLARASKEGGKPAFAREMSKILAGQSAAEAVQESATEVGQIITDLMFTPVDQFTTNEIQHRIGQAAAGGAVGGLIMGAPMAGMAGMVSKTERVRTALDLRDLLDDIKQKRDRGLLVDNFGNIIEPGEATPFPTNFKEEYNYAEADSPAAKKLEEFKAELLAEIPIPEDPAERARAEAARKAIEGLRPVESAKKGDFLDQLQQLVTPIGIEIIWVDEAIGTLSSQIVDGLASKNDNRRVMVNVRAERPLDFILGHEAFHTLKERKGTTSLIARDLESIINAAGPEFQKHQKKINDARAKAGLNPVEKDELIEEAGADFFGEAFLKEEFWQAVAKHTRRTGDSTLMQQLIESALGVARRFLISTGHMNVAPESRALFENYEKAMGLAIRLYSEAATQQDMAKLGLTPELAGRTFLRELNGTMDALFEPRRPGVAAARGRRAREQAGQVETDPTRVRDQLPEEVQEPFEAGLPPSQFARLPGVQEQQEARQFEAGSRRREEEGRIPEADEVRTYVRSLESQAQGTQISRLEQLQALMDLTIRGTQNTPMDLIPEETHSEIERAIQDTRQELGLDFLGGRAPVEVPEGFRGRVEDRQDTGEPGTTQDTFMDALMAEIRTQRVATEFDQSGQGMLRLSIARQEEIQEDRSFLTEAHRDAMDPATFNIESFKGDVKLAIAQKNEEPIRAFLEERYGANELDQYFEEIRKYHDRQSRLARKGESPIHANQKTLMSIDISTDCPLRRMGSPCLYCYVELPRTMKESGRSMPQSPKKVHEFVAYESQILEMPDVFVEFLNERGGLRMFSSGDYTPDMKGEITKLLKHARKKGLMIKAISKQREFLEEFMPKFSNLYVNLSTDMHPEFARELAMGTDTVRGYVRKGQPRSKLETTVQGARAMMGFGFTFEEASELKQRWPKRTRVRYVAMNKREAARAVIHPDVDVVTMYHGITNPGILGELWTMQNPEQMRLLGEETMGQLAEVFGAGHAGNFPENIDQRFLDEVFGPGVIEKEEFDREAKKKVCCRTTICATCKVGCGWCPKHGKMKRERATEVNEAANESPINSLPPAEGPRLSVAQQDAPYLEAVEAGDMQRAQEMVDAAAKDAGYWIHTQIPKTVEADSLASSSSSVRVGRWAFKKVGITPDNLEKATDELDPVSLEVAERNNRIDAGREEVIRDEVESGNGMLVTFKNKPVRGSGTDFFRYQQVIEGEPAGMLIVAADPEGAPASFGYPKIHLRYTDPKFRRQGVQTALTEAALEEHGRLYADFTLSKAAQAQYKGYLERGFIKSAEPVTYDDQGNVIPLSQRFDTTRSDLRFSITQREHTEGADRIAAMSPAEREHVEFNTVGYDLYEARKLVKNLPPDGTKWKKLTSRNSDTLTYEYEWVANVDGEPYGINKEEDPDDESGVVYNFEAIEEVRPENIETMTSDKEEVAQLMLEDKSGAAFVRRLRQSQTDAEADPDAANPNDYYQTPKLSVAMPSVTRPPSQPMTTASQMLRTLEEEKARLGFEKARHPGFRWMESILSSRPQTADEFGVSLLDRWRMSWTDRLAVVEAAINYAKRLSPDTVLPGDDPAMMMRLFASSNARVEEMLDNGILVPGTTNDRMTPGGIEWLMEGLPNETPKALGDALADVSLLMVSERVLDKLIQTNLSEVAGMSEAQANENIRNLKANPEYYKKLEKAAERYRKWAASTIEYAVASGRMARDQADWVFANNQHYVAMQRILQTPAGDEIVVGRRGAGGQIGNVAEPLMKKFKGKSVKPIRDVYESLLNNTHHMIKESDRNTVMLSFVDMISRAGPDALNSIASPVPEGVPVSTKNTIRIYRDGKPEMWEFQSDVYKSVKGLFDLAPLPWAFRILPSIFRFSITYSPPFMVRNLIRDTQHRLTISETGTRESLAATFKKYGKMDIDLLRRFGGDQAGYYAHDRVHYARAIDAAIKDLAKRDDSIVVLPGKLAGFTWGKYSKAVEGSERWNRLREFQAAFKELKPQIAKQLTEEGALSQEEIEQQSEYHAYIQAAARTRGLMDFAVAGTITRVINQVLPFTNAHIQGLRRSLKAVKDDPGAFFARWMTMAVLPSLIVRSLAHSNGSDEEYEAMPDYLKDLFWNIKVSPDLWLRIPKNYEIGVLTSFVERMISKHVYGNEHALEGFEGSLIRTLTPIDEAAMLGPFKAFGEAMFNYDSFRDRQIIPWYEINKDLDLRAGTENASKLGKYGQEFMQMLGLDEYKITGRFSDARMIDFIMRGQFGTLGGMAIQLSDVKQSKRTAPAASAVAGVFANSPAYSSRDVNWIFNTAERRGIPRNSSVLKPLMRALDKLFNDTETPEERDAAALRVREVAAATRGRLEAMRKDKRGPFKEE